jgi:hypothetical protein
MTEKEHIKIILSKMCEIVGKKYEEIDFSSTNWFSNYSWDFETEMIFKNWMIEYLWNNKDARYEIMANPTRDKKEIKRVVEFFIFSYGWKLE